MRLKLIIFIVLFCSLTYAGNKIQIAVMDLSAQDISNSTSASVSDFLRRDLVNTKRFTVLERKNMDVILKEQAFQMTGCTSSECAVEVGKILNVQKVLVGSISKLAGKIVIEARLVDVEKGDVWIAETVKADKEEDLDQAAQELAIKIIKKVSLVGQIMLVGDKSVIIDVGKDYGLTKGVVFEVYRLIKDYKDENREIVMRDEKKIGQVEVISVDEESSKAQIIYQDTQILKDDIIKIPIESSIAFTGMNLQINKWSAELMGCISDITRPGQGLITSNNFGGMIILKYFLNRELNWSIELDLGGFCVGDVVVSDRDPYIYTKQTSYQQYAFNIYYICPIIFSYHIEIGDFSPFVGAGLYYSYSTKDSTYFYRAMDQFIGLGEQKVISSIKPILNIGIDLFKRNNIYLIIDLKCYLGPDLPMLGVYSKDIISAGVGVSF